MPSPFYAAAGFNSPGTVGGAKPKPKPVSPPPKKPGTPGQRRPTRRPDPRRIPPRPAPKRPPAPARPPKQPFPKMPRPKPSRPPVPRPAVPPKFVRPMIGPRFGNPLGPIGDLFLPNPVEWFSPGQSDPYRVFNPGVAFSRFMYICPPSITYPYPGYNSSSNVACGTGVFTCVPLQAITPWNGSLTGIRRFFGWDRHNNFALNRYQARWGACIGSAAEKMPKRAGIVARPRPVPLPSVNPFPWQWDDPFANPPGQFVPDPRWRPAPAPVRAPNPFRNPGERSEGGYVWRPVPRPRPMPEPITLPIPGNLPGLPGPAPAPGEDTGSSDEPGVAPVTSPVPGWPWPTVRFRFNDRVRPGQRVRPRMDRRPARRPPRRMRELKARVPYGAAAGAFRWFINTITEGLDVVDALYKSIPYACRPKTSWGATRKVMMPAQKADFVWRNLDKVDATELWRNLLKNQVEDAFYGFIGKGYEHLYRQSGSPGMKSGDWGTGWREYERKLQEQFGLEGNPLASINELIDASLSPSTEWENAKAQRACW